MLYQHRRQWTKVKPASRERLVFAEAAPVDDQAKWNYIKLQILEPYGNVTLGDPGVWVSGTTTLNNSLLIPCIPVWCYGNFTSR